MGGVGAAPTRGTSFGDWRSDHFRLPEYPAASPSQSQGQEGRAARLQRKKRKREVLRRTLKALVLYDRRGGAGLWRRRKSLGTGCRSVSLRALQDAVSAGSRGSEAQRRRAGNDFGVRIDAAAEGKQNKLLAFSFWLLAFSSWPLALGRVREQFDWGSDLCANEAARKSWPDS